MIPVLLSPAAADPLAVALTGTLPQVVMLLLVLALLLAKELVGARHTARARRTAAVLNVTLVPVAILFALQMADRVLTVPL